MRETGGVRQLDKVNNGTGQIDHPAAHGYTKEVVSNAAWLYIFLAISLAVSQRYGVL